MVRTFSRVNPLHPQKRKERTQVRTTGTTTKQARCMEDRTIAGGGMSENVRETNEISEIRPPGGPDKKWSHILEDT